MPVVPAALAALIETNIDSRMAAISGHHPLQQSNPAFYMEMCQAIGMGIALGAPILTFTSSDSGLSSIPPIPGVISGVGITPNPTFFVEDLYNRMRGYVIADFGKTSHDPYPPNPGNSGEYLQALCQGINDSFQTLYPTSWILAGADPLVYLGTGIVQDGGFSGVASSAIQSLIISSAPNFMGKFWPRTAQAIAESYAALITEHSTATVTITGICIPSIAQVCAIPGIPGTGTGTAA